MKYRYALALLTLGAVLTACGGNDHDGAMGGTPTTPPATTPEPTNFTRLVALNVTEPLASDPTSPPILTDAITFSFPDDENPAAFDAFFTTTP